MRIHSEVWETREDNLSNGYLVLGIGLSNKILLFLCVKVAIALISEYCKEYEIRDVLLFNFKKGLMFLKLFCVLLNYKTVHISHLTILFIESTVGDS